MFVWLRQYVLMRIPTWLKILAVILLLSLVFTALAAVSAYIITTVVLIVLILFPGKDLENPRIVKLVPWFWGLGMVVAVFFLVMDALGKSIMPGADSRPPTPAELWSTILFTPPLVWAFVKRNLFFRPILIVSSLVFVGIEFWLYSDSAKHISDVFDLVGNISAEVILTVYLLLRVKMPTHKSELSQ
jgi:hypothetical protein